MSAKLILINGIPGSGKSVLARAWCERHSAQLPLAMDVDMIRSMLGGWQGALQEAGLAARDIAIAGIRVHLRSGRDVLVAQYLKRPDFIERLDSTARECGAVFVETALTTDARTAQTRFRERAALLAGDDPHGHLPDDMTTIARELDGFLQSRPHVRRLPSGSNALPSLESAIAETDAGRATQ